MSISKSKSSKGNESAKINQRSEYHLNRGDSQIGGEELNTSSKIVVRTVCKGERMVRYSILMKGFRYNVITYVVFFE